MNDGAASIADAEVFERLPAARIDRDNIAFFRGLLSRRLLLNRCADCGNWSNPPWPNCPRCWSDDVRPTEVAGDGTIHSFALRHAGPPREGVDYLRGYPVAVVELVEQAGLRVTARVVGCAPEEIENDLPVRLRWIERDGEPVPAFAPRAAAG